MEFELLGWPASGPTLRLDFRKFSYAGKFVMTTTGKAVIRGDAGTEEGAVGEPNDTALPEGVDPTAFEDDVLAAVAFNEDRTDSETLWLRYVTVHTAHRGRGLGPRLLAFVAERADSRGYDRCRIAVNNPFAYEAAYRAEFAYTGRHTGIAELVLERPASRDTDRYRDGLEQFLDRELSPAEREFIDRKLGSDPPETVDPPA
ncbi:GNAT family N-acetyltransferase [Halalkaliarchaeum desulfuricum]|uniref:GNAT family N-acetyltransferase n=1 Tax=Halalkaliarchaeum desulfuricum TaxID=2055893 RepID=A0A343TKH7_9EURY|nr:GNAT family N-acetyltransferase [Halalkaliarchaeum desulfuricum]AUX09599.1 GNAT family N-acetyltransferase [Halalkaliarchaeum desulfuricum]